MNIAIIGSGSMGSALGDVWARAGHSVTFSFSRDFAKLEQLARDTGYGAKAASPAEAVADADVVLLAILWHTLDDALEQAGSLKGKVIISCTVPMTEDDSKLAVGFTTSGSEVLAERTRARVVSTFNTVWWNVIRDGRTYEGVKPSMFYVGDDDEAKSTAVQLIQDAGFDPVDAGKLEAARLLEPFGLLMGQLGYQYDPLVAYRFLQP